MKRPTVDRRIVNTFVNEVDIPILYPGLSTYQEALDLIHKTLGKVADWRVVKVQDLHYIIPINTNVI